MLAHPSRIPNARPDRSTGLQLPPKRLAQQRPEQLLRLARGLALLGAETFVFLGDMGKLLLQRQRWQRKFKGLQFFACQVGDGHLGREVPSPPDSAKYRMSQRMNSGNAKLGFGLAR